MKSTLPILYVDGQSQGNEQRTQPRNARIAIAYAASTETVDPKKIKIYWRPVGDKTNNEAEYLALLHALSLISDKLGLRTSERVVGSSNKVLIRSDSKLVVNQVGGEWQVEDPKLIELNRRARDSMVKLGAVQLEWIPREQNYAGLWLEGKMTPVSVEKIQN